MSLQIPGKRGSKTKTVTGNKTETIALCPFMAILSLLVLGTSFVEDNFYIDGGVISFLVSIHL